VPERIVPGAPGGGQSHHVGALSHRLDRAQTWGVKRLAVVPLSVALGLSGALVGCGSHAAGPPPTAPPGAVAVYAGPGLQLDQSQYTAKAGKVTIAYIDRDTQRHTLVIEDAAGVIQGTRMVVNGQNDEMVESFALAPGTYTMHCDVPGHGAMHADLVVS
jgi:plastocyanin